MTEHTRDSSIAILSMRSAWDPPDDEVVAIPEPVFNRVLIDNAYEVRRWCQRLVCSEAQLRAAVAKVGNAPEAVRAEIVRLR